MQLGALCLYTRVSSSDKLCRMLRLIVAAAHGADLLNDRESSDAKIFFSIFLDWIDT